MVAAAGHADVQVLEPADGLADLAGSHVVVLQAAPAAVASAVADRAPAAVVVVAGGPEACQAVLEATLLPSPRVIGAPEAEAAAGVVAAVSLDSGAALDCLVRRGDGYEPVRARIGARGVTTVG